ncbi:MULTISPECIES: LURP-one-related/scramblase family protein [Catenuloplanes]|uniref:Uncharacterized protein n=1 Tax=Catenuloplanes niger TaxID=587534 RepID=A0AAE3ZJY1_9ACTN|nr:hypothetical protein [Catenuloplanes niger]MDR7320357.1 hypothetical protein [Catenuloplanes niger]
MLTARKTSLWRDQYEIGADGRVLTTWSNSFWRQGGDFTLDGRSYRVRGSIMGRTFTMTEDGGEPLAEAGRVGRKRWTVTAGGHTYHFRRASFWSGDQELHDDTGRRGSIRRTGFWRTGVVADLPGLPPPVQVFVLGVVISMWNAEQTAAAAGAGGAGG